jgi:hypothetical protein
MRTTIIILIAGSAVFATCNKKLDCTQTVYSFEGNYKAYPDLDSIHINDTIWIELNEPTQLQDLMTNRWVDYSGAENFGPSIQYLQLTGGDVLNTGVVPAGNLFDNVLILGTTIPSNQPELVLGFKCKEENGMYRFKLGIVPKSNGLFTIGASDATGVYRKSNKCDKASFSLIFKNTNQHLYLYEQSRPGYTPSMYERSHLYVFKVY